jgi:hypothetical protein
VHDLVRDGRVRIAELAERVDLQIPTENGLVELHRLAGVAAEGDVRVEA